MACVASFIAERVSTYSAFQQRFLFLQRTQTSSAARSKIRATFSSLPGSSTLRRTVSNSPAYASLRFRTRFAAKRRSPDSPLPRSMCWSIRPTWLRSEFGRSMNTTEAQKVSNRALICTSAVHAHTTESAPARMNDSTKITLPCLPNTPESSPAKE